MRTPTLDTNSLSPLGWQAGPTRALLRLAGPITLSMISFAFMGVIDTLLIGALGPALLAGVGLGIVVTNGLMGFGFGLLRGVKVLLAQARGRGAHQSAQAYAGAGLLVALWLGVLMMALGEVAALFVARFAASAEAGEAARRYIAVRSLGMPIILTYVALREARYGFGETRAPLISAIAGNVAHALLDYVALYVLHLGAGGAATANVLAFSLQALLLGAAQGGGLKLGKAERAAAWEVVRVGAFTGMQFALEIGSLAALSLLLAGVSDHQMAAHQIAVQLAAFCFLPALSIAESATLLTAEALGSGRTALVKVVAHAARNIALAYAGLCALVLLLGGGFIARAFTNDPALISLVRGVLAVTALHQLFEALAVTGHGVLRGVGASRLSALCALSCAWLCTPWLGYTLVRACELGALGAWIARCVELCLASFILWRSIERGDWERADRRLVTALEVGKTSRPSVA